MIYVKDLLELESFRTFDTIGERVGMNRRVSWPNIAQTASIKEWLVGGDVILMTGIGLQVTADFLNSILKQAVEGNAACLVILLHEDHITKVPEESIQYAVERDIQIFQAPWDTRLSNVIMDVSSLAFNDLHKEALMNEFMEKLLTNHLDFADAGNQEKLKKNHLYHAKQTAIARFYNVPGAEKGEKDTYITTQKQMCSFMYTYLKSYLTHLYYIVRNDEMIFVFGQGAYDKEGILQLFEHLSDELGRTFPEAQFLFGIGNPVEHAQQLSLSYEQAKKALLVRKCKTVVDYDGLGIFQLLLEIKDQRRIAEYVDKELHALFEFDRKNHQELVKTLQCYLQCNASLVHAAAQLYIHRNTLIKRIEKIEEILQVSLKDAATRNTYYNCFTLLEYLE
ncbi:MAG: PucR family transcriptional regulator [Lachnospiraceae bacterium]